MKRQKGALRKDHPKGFERVANNTLFTGFGRKGGKIAGRVKNTE